MKAEYLSKLITEAATRHTTAWRQIASSLPSEASWDDINKKCSELGFSHKAVVYNTAKDLGYDELYADIVYAMRNNWPEALSLVDKLNSHKE